MVAGSGIGAGIDETVIVSTVSLKSIPLYGVGGSDVTSPRGAMSVRLGLTINTY